MEHSTQIALILQVGDFGAFPPPFRLDKATRRFAERDPDEISFEKYFNGSPEAEEILGTNGSEQKRITADMLFIKGNHEDFIFLDELEDPGATPIPVDFYGKMFYLRSGQVFTPNIGGIKLKIGCLGGIAHKTGPGQSSISPYYTRSEVRKLNAMGANLDILMTHDAPPDSIFKGAGLSDIYEFIEVFEPKFHFYGHYHIPGTAWKLPEKQNHISLTRLIFTRHTG